MISPTEYRRIVGHFATGVTVITTRDENGRPRGFTANAFSSLSLDPPRVLVCVGMTNQTHPILDAEDAVFGVNILTAHQEEVSRVFASKHPDKFNGLAFQHGLTGVPILAGVLAFLECRVVERFDSGDHTILIGDVCNLNVNPVHQPLLFYQGKYTLLSGSHSSHNGASAPDDRPTHGQHNVRLLDPNPERREQARGEQQGGTHRGPVRVGTQAREESHEPTVAAASGL